MENLEFDPKAFTSCLKNWILAELIFQNLSFVDLLNLRETDKDVCKSVDDYLSHLKIFDTRKVQMVSGHYNRKFLH